MHIHAYVYEYVTTVFRKILWMSVWMISYHLLNHRYSMSYCRVKYLITFTSILFCTLTRRDIAINYVSHTRTPVLNISLQVFIRILITKWITLSPAKNEFHWFNQLCKKTTELLFHTPWLS